ncbi:hypothetical protein MRB53_002302 [Persea americana]|uniref:Uncharacterized protein n=1 Tax=Persea americana TaxID=3435 RepID=A0ACC2MUC1_PERAE|nr:hypothetical protein MRB53_002302 [Persea americana]
MIADQDALKIRLFASTLKGMAFDWYSTLPEDSIQNWTMLVTHFLTHFKDVLPQASLVDICRNIMRARIHSELLEASMEDEMVIKDLNSQKSSKKEPTAIPTSKPKKKEVLNV